VAYRLRRLRYKTAAITAALVLVWLVAATAVCMYFAPHAVWRDARGLSVSQSSTIAAAVASLPPLLLAFAGVGALFGLILYWVLSVRVWKPAGRLAQSIREARETEDSSPRIEMSGRDEFAALVEAINAVLEDSAKSRRNLQAFKMEFERQLLERTRQLDAALAHERQATQRAQSASHAKSDFLAKMSHEIRTPLNGVLGMADLLQHSQTLDDRQRRYAVVIHQSGRALLQLINDLLDFSKIEAGKLELAKERFSLREMVEDSLEIFAERAQSKGLELICDIPVEIDTVVFADSLRLRQVILNLLSNAVKFTHEGDITVSVRTDPGIESSTFTFEIADTGIGIDPAHRETIFDAFVQADASTSRRYGGTGLGLAISRELVELMGGTIDVRSEPGSGSTFQVCVPLAIDRTAAREKPSSMLATMPVLIVEKNPAARRMLRQHLKSWGAATSELTSADALLDRLRHAFSGEFELLILDGHLPDTTPSALVAAIRKIPEFIEAPIIMMHTGTGEPPAEAAAMIGRVVWQSKPIRRSQFENTLKRLLGLEGAEQTRRLPRPAAAELSDRENERASGGVRRVLVVEDNPVNREVARAMLHTLAVHADVACNGKEALEMLSRTSYDAVLMDCQMSDLDGYETTQLYRRWELEHGRSRTPVIALTANALSGDVERCMAAGMDRYISKPVTLEDLRTVLDLHRPTPEVSVAEQSSEVLDPKTIARIRTLSATGTPGLIKRLNDIYESSSSTLVENLRVSGEASNAAAVRKAAHSLKSSSANVGALGLAATCAELEIAAGDERADHVRSLIERLVSEHESVLRALRDTES
jgi:signal transduction histidine kinase/DNA-binding response OmpR family regulator